MALKRKKHRIRPEHREAFQSLMEAMRLGGYEVLRIYRDRRGLQVETISRAGKPVDLSESEEKPCPPRSESVD